MSESQVHKFGGSSLESYEGFYRVAKIILGSSSKKDLIIVSAAGKTTDHLYELFSKVNIESEWNDVLHKIQFFQEQLVEQLVSSENVEFQLNLLIRDVEFIRSSILFGNINKYQMNHILGFGELWSARLLSQLLTELGARAQYLDARDVLIATDDVLPIIYDEISSYKLSIIRQNLGEQHLVITGYICANDKGDTLLLGRNGSDYSATVIASLAKVNFVTIWTDVNGLYTADPKIVKNTKLIDGISFSEADRLAKLGCSLLHHRSLKPIFKSKINLAVRSSYKPDERFTVISQHEDVNNKPVVTFLDSVYLIELKVSSVRFLMKELHEAEVSPLTYRVSGDRLFISYNRDQYFKVKEFFPFLKGKFGVEFINVDLSHGLVALVSRNVTLYKKWFINEFSCRENTIYCDEISLTLTMPKSKVFSFVKKIHDYCVASLEESGVH
ncbi:aspartate kinase [uncultured Shewanella sp.]|uniref:aspartate kinase n=1 Tax=uncultured Shewanella sp. TaxID=173975 RepID=UPI002622437F|nr:aspartate kinase [uncultured Shewanella sp.]